MKTTHLHVRVSIDTLTKLKEMAATDNRSQGNWVENMVENEYKKISKEKKSMKNYVGQKIESVCTSDEIRQAQGNEYGSDDIRVFRNIFDVDNDYWVEGISKVCFEVENGIIVQQIDCL